MEVSMEKSQVYLQKPLTPENKSGRASVWTAECNLRENKWEECVVKLIERETTKVTGYHEYLKREAEILGGLDHPRIVKLYQFIERAEMHIQNSPYNNISYSILEAAPNGDLSSYIEEKGPLPLDQARIYFLQLLSGVRYLHEEKYIVHGDIKPQNILIDTDLNLKICDFDLASQMEGHFGLITGLQGTTEYLAPETIDSEGLDPYSPFLAEIFALGVVLFNMVVGEHPYELSTLYRHQYELLCDNPVSYWSAFSNKFKGRENPLTWQFKQLIMAMLQRNPDDRPSLNEINQFHWLRDP